MSLGVAELLVENLGRLHEEEEETDAKGVYTTLSVIENLAELKACVRRDFQQWHPLPEWCWRAFACTRAYIRSARLWHDRAHHLLPCFRAPLACSRAPPSCNAPPVALAAMLQPAFAESLCASTGVLGFLLRRLQRRTFDANKLYASEVLAILLQASPANARRLAELKVRSGAKGWGACVCVSASTDG